MMLLLLRLSEIWISFSSTVETSLLLSVTFRSVLSYKEINIDLTKASVKSYGSRHRCFKVISSLLKRWTFLSGRSSVSRSRDNKTKRVQTIFWTWTPNFLHFFVEDQSDSKKFSISRNRKSGIMGREVWKFVDFDWNVTFLVYTLLSEDPLVRSAFSQRAC